MIQFLQEAVRQAVAREWRWLALGLFVLTAGTNAVLLSNRPGPDDAASAIFVAVAVVRLGGLLLLTVAALRLATQSARHPFLPDLAFAMYLALIVIGFLIGGALRLALGGEPTSIFQLGMAQALGVLLSAPFMVWTTALAVERRLAINPVLWFRRLVRWLPAVLVWSFLVIAPLSILHAYVNLGLIEGWIPRSVFVEVVDGLVSVVILLLGLAMGVVAYRRVANG